MKHPENLLAYWGLAVAVVMAGAYILSALCLKKKPDLTAAVSILISATGASGAVRLIGFAFTDQFKEVVAGASGTVWGLTAEDSVFLVVGGLSLGWVCCQEILLRFRGLSKAVPA